MVYGTYNELVTGAYKSTYNWGASHCRDTSSRPLSQTSYSDVRLCKHPCIPLTFKVHLERWRNSSDPHAQPLRFRWVSENKFLPSKKHNYFTSCDPHHDIYTFSYWQIFSHSIWHIFWLAFYLAYLLAYDLAYLLAFYLTNLLAFYLAYLLAFYLTYLLAFNLAFYLAYLLAYILTYLLAFYLTYLLA